MFSATSILSRPFSPSDGRDAPDSRDSRDVPHARDAPDTPDAVDFRPEKPRKGCVVTGEWRPPPPRFRCPRSARGRVPETADVGAAGSCLPERASFGGGWLAAARAPARGPGERHCRLIRRFIWKILFLFCRRVNHGDNLMV
jgi:hypothetical protein